MHLQDSFSPQDLACALCQQGCWPKGDRRMAPSP
jgi:hypothetical protein